MSVHHLKLTGTILTFTTLLLLAGCFHVDDCGKTSNAAASEDAQCNTKNDTPEQNTSPTDTTDKATDGSETSPSTSTTTQKLFTPKANTYYKFQTMFLENDNKCLEGNKLGKISTLKGAAFMDNCQSVSGQSWKFVDQGNGYFRINTLFLEDENRCLEGNKIGATSTLGGAAFMDGCQDVSGQLWKVAEDESNPGYYRLQTKFLENDDKCLEGNQLASSATLDGAAFMDACQDATGQLWKFVEITETETVTIPATPEFIPDPDKYYTLQTLLLEDENKCLEGNFLDSTSTLNGASFMDVCQNVTGQFWKFIDKGNGHYQLTTQFLEGSEKCLEGNGISPTSTLGGAAFMAGCGNFTGQKWYIVPDDSGYYRLQTIASKNENKCFEGNRLDPNSTLEGAAFMDNCQSVSGQLWTIKEL